MSRSRELAIDLYRKFHETEPTKIDRARLIVPDYALEIGALDYVGYTTIINGKRIAFEHSFASGSRPRLCASADGRQLLVVGGRYNFKEDGIVDRDARGKSIYPR